MKINSEASALLAQIKNYQSQISDARRGELADPAINNIPENSNFGSEISKLMIAVNVFSTFYGHGCCH